MLFLQKKRADPEILLKVKILIEAINNIAFLFNVGHYRDKLNRIDEQDKICSIYPIFVVQMTLFTIKKCNVVVH